MSDSSNSTETEDSSAASSLTDNTDSATYITVNGKKIEDLSVTANNTHQRNDALVTNLARKKMFKFVKFTFPDMFAENSFLWHVVAAALNCNKVRDKDKINYYFNTHRRAIIEAVARRRCAVTNQMKKSFVSK